MLYNMAILSADVYKEMILDLYKNPLHRGVLDPCDVWHRDGSMFCGDDITIFIRFGKGKIIEDISHSGHGCAISQAAVSLLTEHVKKKTKDDALHITNEQMVAMLGIPISPARMGCALLGLKALRGALEKET